MHRHLITCPSNYCNESSKENVPESTWLIFYGVWEFWTIVSKNHYEQNYFWFQKYTNTYTGAGSPSASHSIMKGLSFSSGRDLTWKSNSSVGGCFTIFGGLWTERKEVDLNKLLGEFILYALISHYIS